MPQQLFPKPWLPDSFPTLSSLSCRSDSSKQESPLFRCWKTDPVTTDFYQFKRRENIFQFGPHQLYCMAPHSSTLAWKIPRTEEPGRLQSMESDTSENRTRLSDFTFPFHFYALGKESATCRGPALADTGSLRIHLAGKARSPTTAGVSPGHPLGYSASFDLSSRVKAQR